MTTLFEHGILRSLTVKNRIVMAPMCMYSSDDEGMVKDFHLIHYGARAIGGVGLILLESTAVEKRGRISANDLGIWTDDHIGPLKKLVDLIHKFGGKVGVQLGHAGRKCGVDSEEAICPSKIAFSEKYQIPTEMSKEDIKETVKAFSQAARRANMAGFDTIEIHGAHGYLINQFLSPLTNHREDEYGGSIENRSNFLKEVIRGIRLNWPKEKPVILRISAEEYEKGGNKCEDLGKIINLVKKYGIDLINVSSGGAVMTKINTYPGYQLKFAEKIKDYTGLPVIAGGLVTTAEMAEKALQNERADYIYLGRELLRNPNWPFYAAKALGYEIKIAEQYERAYQ